MNKKSKNSGSQLKINFNKPTVPKCGKVINFNNRIENINRNSITRDILRNTKSF